MIRHLRADGTKLTQADWQEALQLVTVVAPEGTEENADFERYPGCPTMPTVKNGRVKKDGKRVFTADEKGNKSRTDDDLVITQCSNDVIKGVINRLNKQIYEDIIIDRAFYKGNTANQVLIVKVKGPGCNYCHNKQGDHNSNTVYFLFTMHFMVQRCYSTKVRQPVSCNNYSSRRITLTEFEVKQLFTYQDRGKKQVLNLNAVLHPTTKPKASTSSKSTVVTNTQVAPSTKKQKTKHSGEHACRLRGLSEILECQYERDAKRAIQRQKHATTKRKQAQQQVQQIQSQPAVQGSERGGRGNSGSKGGKRAR